MTDDPRGEPEKRDVAPVEGYRIVAQGGPAEMTSQAIVETSEVPAPRRWWCQPVGRPQLGWWRFDAKPDYDDAIAVTLYEATDVKQVQGKGLGVLVVYTFTPA